MIDAVTLNEVSAWQQLFFVRPCSQGGSSLSWLCPGLPSISFVQPYSQSSTGLVMIKVCGRHVRLYYERRAQSNYAVNQPVSGTDRQHPVNSYFALLISNQHYCSPELALPFAWIYIYTPFPL